MKLTKCLLLLGFMTFHFSIVAQIRWTGLAGNGQWHNTNNWEGQHLPGLNDDVLIDNYFVPGSYQVSLPDGTVTVTIRSLTIKPAPGNNITVLLPAGNTGLPGLRCNRSPYGVELNNGAIFNNASGAPAVSNTVTVAIADSLKINNGGRYMHTSPRTHTNVVEVLSAAPGTETGIFDINLRSGSGPLIAFAGRTFGTLQLSATAAGGPKTYNANGSTAVTIRGNLILGDDVNFNLGFSDTVFIRGDLEQQGGRFNLGTGAYPTVVQIGGHLLQSKGSITELNTGLPSLLMKGSSSQFIRMADGIYNSVTLTIDNPAGIVLQSPLTLPYCLALVQGIVHTSPSNLLTLEAGCSIRADSLAASNFINGPLRKLGLAATQQFLFPVGKGDALRWMTLKDVTGNYTVEFFRGNPRQMSQQYHSGLHHISGIEYWRVTADGGPLVQAQVKLSFNDPNSGGVTDLAALRVAVLTGSTWLDAGHTASGGTPGSNGFVTSHMLQPFGSHARYFTLASTSGSFNPLRLLPRIPAGQGAATALTLAAIPSLAHQFTRLHLDTRYAMRVQVRLTHSTGRVVQQFTVALQKGKQAVFIDTSLLPAGLYTIQVMGEGKRFEPVRFIKY